MQARSRIFKAQPMAVPNASSADSLDASAHEAEQHVALGQQLSQKSRFIEAEACYLKALELNPNYPIAHNNLGGTLQAQGDSEGAVASYQRALQLDPHLRIARRNLAMLLVQLGRGDESFPLWHQEILSGSEGLGWMEDLVSTAMQARDLTLAGEYAALLATLRWASPWCPRCRDNSVLRLPVDAPTVYLTIPKLRHDIEQFKYLQRHNIVGEEFTTIIQEYQRTIVCLAVCSQDVRVPLDDEAQRTISHVYNRIVHVRNTPRVWRALSGEWDATTLESQYLDKPPGLVIVDEFLCSEALQSVRLFCLESTVWSANRYAHGRLGAFFRDGFNCPLLVQIAEELRQALPRVIGDRYPLRQLWGFKNAGNLPADSTNHADFAAVNVNFWITPDDANWDEGSGGLVVYDVDAPLSWDFNTYNSRPDIIKSFLQHQQARPIYIPYRQNRAIIFNSDLFHATAAVRFRSEYENRRVNVTMLYGDRANDVHHYNHRDATLISSKRRTCLGVSWTSITPRTCGMQRRRSTHP
jgi:tetratricopeptide (TPR) repeat protein